MNGPAFQHTTKPPSNVVVEVLSEKWDGNGWKIQLARWCEHRAQWIHDWTGNTILDDIVGWREKTVCGCEKYQTAA